MASSWVKTDYHTQQAKELKYGYLPSSQDGQSVGFSGIFKAVYLLQL